MKSKMKILFTMHYRKDGGVYSFCEALLPAFHSNVDTFKRGTKNTESIKILR